MSTPHKAGNESSHTEPRRKWSRKEKYVFLPIVVLFPVILVLGLLAAIDVYLHNRHFEGRYGLNTLNIWGYRGDVAPAPSEDQLRLAVVGGSTAWGYGVPVNESMPFILEQQLEQDEVAEDVAVMNLAYNNEGAYAFAANLEDYLDLDYDIVVMYTGVNDSGGENRLVWRRTSPIFRVTGYLPILPDLVNQLLNNWRSGRGLNNPEDPKIVFDEDFQDELRDRVVTGDIEKYLQDQREQEMGPGSLENIPESESGTPHGFKTADATCAEPWTFYCSQVARAIDFVRSQGKLVLVVGEPFVTEAQAEQQRELLSYLESRYTNDPAVEYADFGLAVDVTDPSVAFDGMHLTERGNRSIAEQLVEPVRSLIQANE